MTKRAFTALLKRLSPHLPEARVKLPVIIFPPFREVLKGLYFERSGSDTERFYVWVFFMPLCVPARHVTFNLGRRIGGNDQRWDFKDQHLAEKIISSVEREALPFLKSVQRPREAARFALSMGGTARSPHAQQANAYLLAQAGETNEASKSLDQLLYLLKLDIPWQAEMAARAQRLQAFLVNCPADAKAQLQSWECDSIHNLELEDIGFTITR